jgi:hypothetical protein
MWGKLRANPQVQQAAGTIAHKGNDMAHAVADKAADKAPNWMPGSRSDAEATIGTTGTANGQNGVPAGMPASGRNF